MAAIQSTRWRVFVTDGVAAVEKRLGRLVRVGKAWVGRLQWKPYRAWSATDRAFPECDSREDAIAQALDRAENAVTNMLRIHTAAQDELRHACTRAASAWRAQVYAVAQRDAIVLLKRSRQPRRRSAVRRAR